MPVWACGRWCWEEARRLVLIIPPVGTTLEGWWWGGACSPHDGCLYYVPGGAKRVLKFDPATGTRKLIGPELTGLGHKYAVAVLGDDGKIYGIPVEAERVLRAQNGLPPPPCRDAGLRRMFAPHEWVGACRDGIRREHTA